MFIYLNRPDDIGLVQAQFQRRFQRPAGRYRNPKICDEDTLRSAAAVLGSGHATLQVQSLTEVDRTRAAGALVALRAAIRGAERHRPVRSYVGS